MPDCYAQKTACEDQHRYVLECEQWRDDGYAQCAQWQDQGYAACDRYEDHGYNTCSQWEKNCCTWAPCSWACNAFTWLCRAWVWVSNIVCVSWVWVANVVCVSWVWVVNLVCVAWRWVVNTAWLAYCLAQYWTCILPECLMNAWLNAQAHVFVFRQCRKPQHTPRNPREKPGWTLTFEDDFTTGILDPAKWIDLAYYGLRFGASPSGNYYSPTSFSFGATTISLLGEDVPITVNAQTFPYQVGHIEWPAPLEQKHGYFEIRCRIPDTDEMWPAFWLASRHAWPPEIDIFEFYTNDLSSFESTQHWGVDTGSGHPKETRKHPVCLAGKLFHIYACEWKPGEIRWYYDNQLVRIATNGLNDFVHPMHVIVNNAVDTRPGHFPQNAAYPSQFIVDYVRVYA